MRPTRTKLPNVPLKYQMDGLKKLIQKQHKATIAIKSGLEEVDFCDVEDFPIHTSGTVIFEQGDLEDRKEGYFIFKDVSSELGFPPHEQARVVALGELEGKHLLVLITKTGTVLSSNREFWRDWFLNISLQGNCSIVPLEMSKEKFITFVSKKSTTAQTFQNRKDELEEELKKLQQKKRTTQTKKTKLLKEGKDVTELDKEVKELETLIAECKKEIPELQKQIDAKQVEDIISSDESDAEEYEEEIIKSKKKIKLSDAPIELKKADLKIKNAEILEAEITDDDDEDDEDFVSAEEESSSSEDSEDSQATSSEEEDNYDDGDVENPIEIEDE